MKTITIQVEGMSCGHCVSTIEGVLTKVDGVKEATVNLGEKKVTVLYDEVRVSVEKLSSEIEELGYEVS